VPEDEWSTYITRISGSEAILLRCPTKGIGNTRQWIVDQCTGKYILMLDDDLTFFKRRNDDRTKFEKASVHDVGEMLNSVHTHLEFHAHVGICTREGGNRLPDKLYRNTRTLRALAYDVHVLRKHDIRFDAMHLMEDFYVSLSLLTAGYANVLLSDWVHDQVGSNTEGGCSQYRTMDEQARAAKELSVAFPKYVTLVRKKTKTAWGGKERIDVRIQWKKAYADGRRQANSLD
jgi:glycosyltransferase involved in cell wall biosynthesis